MSSMFQLFIAISSILGDGIYNFFKVCESKNLCLYITSAEPRLLASQADSCPINTSHISSDDKLCPNSFSRIKS